MYVRFTCWVSGRGRSISCSQGLYKTAFVRARETLGPFGERTTEDVHCAAVQARTGSAMFLHEDSTWGLRRSRHVCAMCQAPTTHGVSYLLLLPASPDYPLFRVSGTLLRMARRGKIFIRRRGWLWCRHSLLNSRNDMVWQQPSLPPRANPLPPRSPFSYSRFPAPQR